MGFIKKDLKFNTIIIQFRRVSQIIFLLLFFYLFLIAIYRGEFQANRDVLIRPNSGIKFFFDIDPLVMISTLISTWSIYKGLFWSLIIISITIVMGRFFCGWICPLGTLNHYISVIKPKISAKVRIVINKSNEWHKFKYYLLVIFLLLSLLGSNQVGLMDPIAFLWRSLTTSVYPAIMLGWDYLSNFIYNSGIGYLYVLIDYINLLFNKVLFPSAILFYRYGWVIGIMLVVVLYLNRKVPRFWCRYVCPLGALLGLFARLSIYGVERKEGKCDNCGVCLLDCQGGAEPDGKGKWIASECMMCFNCVDGCDKGAIKFKFFPDNGNVKQGIDLDRRAVAMSVGVGVLFLPLVRVSGGMRKNYSPYLIRPPGSLEESEFLQRCIKCGGCMKICPTNALHPAFYEGGIEGLWTPVLIPRIGYCESSCVLCGYACPTGAIKQLVEEGKLGKDNRGGIKIGLAAVDRGRCLPWAMNTPCIVCEEHCPTSPKAIYLEKVAVRDREGKEIELQLPYVDSRLCWGCGICEYKCPVKDKPAIYVTNIGETRSKSNRLMLMG